MNIVNLEPLCAFYGMQLADNSLNIKTTDMENVITKALGVLVEKGIFAMTVFLMTVGDKSQKYSDHVLITIANLLSDDRLKLLPKEWKTNKRENKDAEAKGTSGIFFSLLRNMRDITEELPKLLLARKVLEETLTFARYHCKAIRKITGE